MDYGALMRDAWATTWRFRFLWILGGLAGATGSTLGMGRSSLPAFGQDQLTTELGTWLVAAAVGVVLLGVVSVFARGGITQATIDIEYGQASSLMSAWRAGVRWFWRFLGLLAMLGVLAASVVAIAVVSVTGLGAFGVLVATLVLTIGAIASVVLAYAERAIVTRDLGVLAAIRYGWWLFREHLSASLLAWVVSVGLSAAFGMFAALSVPGLLAAASAPAFVMGLGLLVLLVAIGNTFFWSYWTLIYLRLDNSNGQLAAA
jgi:hypothetical protein